MSVAGISEVFFSFSAFAAASVFNLCSSHLSVMTMYARPITTGIYKENKKLLNYTMMAHFLQLLRDTESRSQSSTSITFHDLCNLQYRDMV